MPSRPQFTRIDTLELKSQIIKKLGRLKAEKYFCGLNKLLNLKLTKLEYEKLLYSIIGKENLSLHNLFIKSILSNAFLSHGPPSKQMATGRNGHIRSMFPMSPRKVRSVSSHDLRFHDRPIPLDPHGKVPTGNAQEVTNSGGIHRSREQQCAPELISIGSKALLEVASVEDGEEVEQVRGSPDVESRSPVTAPFGLNFGSLPRKALYNGSAVSLPKLNASERCHVSNELPDTRVLRNRLEAKFEHEGLNMPLDCVNLLNNGLDTYLKRLIRPCMDLASSRCSSTKMNRVNENSNHRTSGVWHEEHVQRAQQSHSASILDFQVAMESNPQLLGGDWPIQLEKISSFIR